MSLIRDDLRKEITLRKAAMTIIVLVDLLSISLFVALIEDFGLCVGLIIVVSGMSTGLCMIFVNQIIQLKLQLDEPDNPLLVERIVEENHFTNPVYIHQIVKKEYNENPPLIEKPEEETNLL